jgi:hypothetical protein
MAIGAGSILAALTEAGLTPSVIPKSAFENVAMLTLGVGAAATLLAHFNVNRAFDPVKYEQHDDYLKNPREVRARNAQSHTYEYLDRFKFLPLSVSFK